jgi:hypothetical protein
MQLQTDETKEILGEYLANDDFILVTHRDINGEQNMTSIAIAAFTTTYARLKLYEVLDEIENTRKGRVLYYDTDSVIFTHIDGESKPKTGDFLGDLCDEIAKDHPNGKCTKFISCGPKVYGLEIRDRETNELIASPMKRKLISTDI